MNKRIIIIIVALLIALFPLSAGNIAWALYLLLKDFLTSLTRRLSTDGIVSKISMISDSLDSAGIAKPDVSPLVWDSNVVL